MLSFVRIVFGEVWGRGVAQLVEELRYKTEYSGFDS